MEKPDKKTIEESLVGMRELLPRCWWALYQGSLEAGFSKSQSFALVQTYILGQNPNGSRPNDPVGIGPDSDNPDKDK